MQQLHLVGFTTDIEGLIFSARKGSRSGGYVVTLDDRLLARIEEALRLRAEDDTEGSNGRHPGQADDARPVGRARRANNGAGDVGDAGESEDEDDGAGRPARESALTPREMQARLRAGFSIAEVASEAHVDEEWVSRFAAPILAEQDQVIERAQSLVYTAPRKGPGWCPASDTSGARDDERDGHRWPQDGVVRSGR